MKLHNVKGITMKIHIFLTRL